ncbi:hypothetical protein D1AOALGA4SA_12861 [Olavius algarvensis Delta 1 endosymbiont]|nr:hypothetical protein D1AOALGA4SA_12861 [Olavius algarvensis Delta 1 endosymbiont]
MQFVGFRFQVSGFGCQETGALNSDTSCETTLECRMSNVE